VTDEVRNATAAADGSESVVPETTTEPDDSVTEDATGDEDSDEDSYEEEADSPAPVERRRRGLAPVVRKFAPVVLVFLALISGGVATWLYFERYRPDQQTDPAAAHAVAKAASDGTVAVLSYSFDSLDKDFANAKSHLAGDFLSYYSQFSQASLAPVAKQKSMKTTAHVTEAAVSELRPDSAVVLVFVDQSTTIKDSPQTSLAVNSVLVRMTRINDSWKITGFTPF
jgi:Mce-associated membrane protein